MIELKNITFTYPGAKKPVFKNFNLTLTTNKIYGLFGENGTGKSTLLYLMMGLLHVDKQSHGSILVDGDDIGKRHGNTLANIYIVPDEFKLPNMSFGDYVKTYSSFYPNFSNEILDNCLKEFNLPLNIDMHSLSLGQKKLALVSFALATCTKYLLMDEPINGLDSFSKKQFRKIIVSSMTEERTIVIATHQFKDIESIFDHIIIIDHSDVLMDKSIEQLSDSYVFDIRRDVALDGSELYVERTIDGNKTISRHESMDNDTPVDVELLYHAVVNKKI